MEISGTSRRGLTSCSSPRSQGGQDRLVLEYVTVCAPPVTLWPGPPGPRGRAAYRPRAHMTMGHRGRAAAGVWARVTRSGRPDGAPVPSVVRDAPALRGTGGGLSPMLDRSTAASRRWCSPLRSIVPAAIVSTSLAAACDPARLGCRRRRSRSDRDVGRDRPRRWTKPVQERPPAPKGG